MKIIKISPKLQKVKLRVECNDDLFYLKNFIEPGDLVKARTPRTVFLERDGEIRKVGKKLMVIKIAVEKVEFQTGTFQLRVSGRIVEAPKNVQIDSYHSIEIKPGKHLTITKREWKNYQIEKLKEAEKKSPNIMIVAIDLDQALLYLLKNNRIEQISEIRNPFSFNYEEKKISEYYRLVAEEIMKFYPQMKHIILAGPGFAKEHVFKIIREKSSEAFKKIFVSNASSATIAGINEIIKSGVVESLGEENEILKETKLVEEFFMHLKKDDGLAIFGINNISSANNMGAIEFLLVSEDMLSKEVEEIAKQVEMKGGKVKIISTLHNAGQQFRHIGIGAILRFKLSWS
ncbi:MAG: mRNA surveillance protein pelota [Candidatus Aenigmatarchaeota archaeon]